MEMARPHSLMIASVSEQLRNLPEVLLLYKRCTIATLIVLDLLNATV